MEYRVHHNLRQFQPIPQRLVVVVEATRRLQTSLLAAVGSMVIPWAFRLPSAAQVPSSVPERVYLVIMPLERPFVLALQEPCGFPSPS